jgi:hypothetical protein
MATGLDDISAALIRAKVMETIAGRIAIGFVGIRYTLGHHLSGGIFVVGTSFFFFFAIQTNGPVIENRQDSAVFGF